MPWGSRFDNHRWSPGRAGARKIPSWLPVDAEIARRAGELARAFRATHGGIDTADYSIAATVQMLEAELLTTNVRHFPMLKDLRAPY